MTRTGFVLLFSLPLSELAAEPPPHDPSGVIGFDLCSLDASGLIGAPGAKRALHYELCIPRGQDYAAQVRTIEPDVAVYEDSPGRIGCGPEQVLVVGSTQRPDFALVLQRLAELPYVTRIEQAHFE